jgi:hypothetical protein
VTVTARDADGRRGRNTAWLAWGLFALTILFLAAALLLAALDGLQPDQSPAVLALASFSLTGLLVALRQPNNAVGWLCSALGLSNMARFFLDQYVWSALTIRLDSFPVPEWVGLFSKTILSGIGWFSFFIVIMLFPNGSFLSRRWRLAGLIGLSLTVLYSFGLIAVSPTIPGYTFPVTNPLRLGSLAGAWNAITPLFFLIAIPLFYTPVIVPPVLRYRRAKSEVRQQIKWLAFAMLPWLLLVIGAVLYAITGSTLLDLFLGLWVSICIAAVSVSIGIAILRYRLYDIDLIIRRTLIYGVLTALLAGVYFGGVVLLQALLRPLTGPGNDLAVVATTLIIAAFALPLRRRVQGFIDRRFYRRKYDAAETMAAFGEQIRDEVELDKLTGRLVEVVDETMHPAHVSLWLRDPGRQPNQTASEDLP